MIAVISRYNTDNADYFDFNMHMLLTAVYFFSYDITKVMFIKRFLTGIIENTSQPVFNIYKTIKFFTGEGRQVAV